jgi:hypothetical protein
MTKETLDPYEVLRDAVEASDRGYANSPQMLEDFRFLFFSSPQGKRVFNQIMSWSGFFRTGVVKGDPYATHVREGEKNIAARIWAACLTEVRERPTETNKKGD